MPNLLKKHAMIKFWKDQVEWVKVIWVRLSTEFKNVIAKEKCSFCYKSNDKKMVTFFVII